MLKSGVVSVKNFKKLNSQFNLKQRSVLSDPEKTQFLRFMTKTVSATGPSGRSHCNYLNKNFCITCIGPTCSCGVEPETTLHYLLHCNLYPALAKELLNDVFGFNPTLKN